jgi:KAP-like P-loop domain-containing protein
MSSYHNDEPTLHDELGRLGLVKTVGDALAECRPPHVFGVHGDWGAGKTSFLHQVHLYLTGICPEAGLTAKDKGTTAKGLFGDDWQAKPNVTVVWFEAWRYQFEAAPIVALLHEMRTQLAWYTRWLTQGQKLLEVSIRGALLSLEDVTKKIGFQASKIEKAGKEWEQEHLATKLPSHAIREHLEAAFGELLKGGKGRDRASPRVVVLIDDLDRCQGASAFKLLEGLKIYMGLKNCVFVLGMDQNVVEDAITRGLADGAGQGSAVVAARNYLEKICKDTWYLPILTNPGKLLVQWVGDTPVARKAGELVDQYRCLPANPRKIKAYANLLKRYLAQLNHTQPTEPGEADTRHASLIVIMAYLYQFHHRLYRVLETRPKFYRELVLWCRGHQEEARHPLLRELEPDLVGETDPTAPLGADPTQVEAYPDPVLGNVLRVQRLVEITGGVEASDLAHYLIDRPA